MATSPDPFCNIDEALNALHDIEVWCRSALPPHGDAGEHSLPEWAAEQLDLAAADLADVAASLAH